MLVLKEDFGVLPWMYRNCWFEHENMVAHYAAKYGRLDVLRWWRAEGQVEVRKVLGCSVAMAALQASQLELLSWLYA